MLLLGKSILLSGHRRRQYRSMENSCQEGEVGAVT